jgi:hypothetical protein
MLTMWMGEQSIAVKRLSDANTAREEANRKRSMGEED